MVEFLQENSTYLFFGLFALLMVWMHAGGKGHGSHGGHSSHQTTRTPDDVSPPTGSATDAGHVGHTATGSQPRAEADRGDAERETAAAGRHRGGC